MRVVTAHGDAAHTRPKIRMGKFTGEGVVPHRLESGHRPDQRAGITCCESLGEPSKASSLKINSTLPVTADGRITELSTTICPESIR